MICSHSYGMGKEYMDTCNYISDIERAGIDRILHRELRKLEKIIDYKIKNELISAGYACRWQHTLNYLKSLIKRPLL